MAAAEDQLQPRLQRLMSRVLGEAVTIAQLRRLTAGAGSQTWSFVATGAAGEHELILRRGHEGELFGGALDKNEEAQVLEVAVAAGVPAPSVLARLSPDDGLGVGFIMPRIAGETLPQKILREPSLAAARERMAGQCGEILAAIHAVEASALPTLRRADAARQLDFYQRAYRDFGEALPVFDCAFHWLRRHLPETERRTLVHGDFRNGNLMVGEEGVRAVLDWELSHIGEPMEDLGWLCVNSWRFGRREQPVGGFGSREDLFAAYEKASGRAVDAEAVKCWELFGVLKWGVICLYQTHVHLSGRERSVERLAIGRRVSECELDMVDLMRRGWH